MFSLIFGVFGFFIIINLQSAVYSNSKTAIKIGSEIGLEIDLVLK
jgi:hypothetical protein